MNQQEAANDTDSPGTPQLIRNKRKRP